jgi:Tfp pilus assembly protein PilZ
MRILTANFASKSDFLTHIRDVEKGGAIFCRTDADLRIGEPVLVEIDFPGLPNRALVRGAVSGFDALGAGAWVEFAEEDTTTRDFLLALAQGELLVQGTVAWVRTEGRDVGMGICFAESERDVHVLKEILDQVSDKGRFSFLLPRAQS